MIGIPAYLQQVLELQNPEYQRAYRKGFREGQEQFLELLEQFKENTKDLSPFREATFTVTSSTEEITNDDSVPL